MNDCEVIIVGVGGVGVSALLQLARRGVRVMGIDRYSPPHSYGSSHGETRVTRQATGEGIGYVSLVMRSNETWCELERESGVSLLEQCGFLAIDGAGGESLRHGRPGFFQTTTQIAEDRDIVHEVLSADETMYRYPAFRLAGDEQCYFEPGGGIVFPERAISVQCDLAEKAGAVLRRGEKVLSIASVGDHVEVRTESDIYRSAQVVVSAGAWTPKLVGEVASPLRILREVVHWFEADPPPFHANRFPTFMWLHGPGPEDSFYGFPPEAGLTPGIKMASEQFSISMNDPDSVDRNVTSAEASAMYERHVAGRIGGVSGQAVRSSACLYTHAPDGHFVIDRLPGSDRILVASACSGHGFKHSAAVGEHIANVLVGTSDLDPTFALGRAAMSRGPVSALAAPL